MSSAIVDGNFILKLEGGDAVEPAKEPSARKSERSQGVVQLVNGLCISRERTTTGGREAGSPHTSSGIGMQPTRSLCDGTQRFDEVTVPQPPFIHEEKSHRSRVTVGDPRGGGMRPVAVAVFEGSVLRRRAVAHQVAKSVRWGSTATPGQPVTKEAVKPSLSPFGKIL